MFADIAGFTAMSETMDPEEVTVLMNKCFDMMSTIIENHEGTVDKFIGDCIMASFGVPLAIEDAPQKCINAAIEMRKKLDEFSMMERLVKPLKIHAGINTGIVIAGAVGSTRKQEYTVMGDTVNIASGYKDASGKDQIFVGPKTYAFTRDDFDYRELTPIIIKGKQQPVKVYELRSQKEKLHRAELGSERLLFSDMVGRDDEMAQLKDLVRKLHQGQGAIVNIVGEAGIGKSRLVAELKRIPEVENTNFIMGRAISIGQNLSFHPFVDILRNWAQITREDDDEEQTRKLGTAINRIEPDKGQEILPFVATLMGIKLTGTYAQRLKGIGSEGLERLIMKNFKDLIAHSARISPIILVMEDLHWSDTSSIELLNSIFTLVENEAILFINILRPGYERSSDKILDSVTERFADYHKQIDLNPLSGTQSDALISNLLGKQDFPPEVRSRISRRAQGNPFFIEEVGRSLVDAAAVKVKEGKIVTTSKIDSVVIPDSINDVLMTRIDRLGHENKSLLKVASVMGRNFHYKVLSEVQSGIPDIDNRLNHLSEIQLLEKGGRTHDPEYYFKQPLIQEVTYESILLGTRKELHLKTARAIEHVFADRLSDNYGLLALHFSQGGDLEKADEYLVKAGEEAMRSAASAEALHYYQEALSLYIDKSEDDGDPGRIAMLERNTAYAYWAKGLVEGTIEHSENYFRIRGDREPRNKIHTILAILYNFVKVLGFLYLPGGKRPKRVPGERENEYFALRRIWCAATASLDPARLSLWIFRLINQLKKYDIRKVESGATFLGLLGLSLTLTGVSFRLAKKAIDLANENQQEDDPRMKADLFTISLLYDSLSGNWNDEMDLYVNHIREALRVGETFVAASTTHYAGLTKPERGNFEDADRLIQMLADIGTQYDNEQAYGRSMILKTKLLLKQRRLPEAIQDIDSGIEFLHKVGLFVFLTFGTDLHKI